MSRTGRRRLILVVAAVVGGLLVGVVGSQLDRSDDETAPTTTTTLSLEQELAERPCLQTVERAEIVQGPWGPALAAEPVTDLTSAADDVFPTSIVTVPGTDTVLVGDRDGAVWAIEGDEAPREVLDLRSTTAYEGDGGLLNLAIDPTREVLYVLRTAEDGATTLSSHPLSADGLSVGEGREIIAVERPGDMHAGGALVVLADGTVLVGIGDGGGIGGPGERAQQVDGLLGKLLRIDPRPGEDPAYVVPADNPLVASEEERPEIVGLGLRNPYRAAVDEQSGRLFLPDVGQSCREEINVVPATAWTPRNYGWPMWEGTHRFKPEGAVAFGHSPPVYDYLAGCAVIGGFVYHGTAIPELDGRYLYGDWCDGWIRGLRVDLYGRVLVEPVAQVDAPTSISAGPGGEPWITTATDQILRLGPERPGGPTTVKPVPTIEPPDAGSSVP